MQRKLPTAVQRLELDTGVGVLHSQVWCEGVTLHSQLRAPASVCKGMDHNRAPYFLPTIYLFVL